MNPAREALTKAVNQALANGAPELVEIPPTQYADQRAHEMDLLTAEERSAMDRPSGAVYRWECSSFGCLFMGPVSMAEEHETRHNGTCWARNRDGVYFATLAQRALRGWDYVKASHAHPEAS